MRWGSRTSFSGRGALRIRRVDPPADVQREWLPSLPLHPDLHALLGITPPQFDYLLPLNSNGSKMSKWKGDVDALVNIRPWTTSNELS